MSNALIFDCDGVLADTERFAHLPAFNRTFADVGLDVVWSEDDYAEKLKTGGGKERMATMFTPQFVAEHGLPADADGQRELLADWHRRKTAHYTAMINSGEVPARPGIARLVDEARAAGWRLAVASTSALPSVQAVLEHAVGPEVAAEFELYCGDVVPAKKPAPDIYLLALEKMGLRPDQAVVIEDSNQGLRASTAAGIPTVVTLSSYTADEDMSTAALVVSDLGEPGAPMQVVANPAGLPVAEMVHLADLAALVKP